MSADDHAPLRVAAAIREMFPNGAIFQTINGRRLDAPQFYPWCGGLKSLVNGSWHLFDKTGRFVSEGEGNRIARYRVRSAGGAN